MKYLLMLSTFLLTFQAHAEIFVCKDGKGRITYQEKPCLTIMVNKLKNIPDAPIEDQILAQNRINKANEMYRQREAKAEVERQQQAAHDRALELIEIEKRKLELLERQTVAAERAAASRWVVGVGYHRLGSHHKMGSHRSGSHKAALNKTIGGKVEENRVTINITN